jgi:hypothetical protein
MLTLQGQAEATHTTVLRILCVCDVLDADNRYQSCLPTHYSAKNRLQQTANNSTLKRNLISAMHKGNRAQTTALLVDGQNSRLDLADALIKRLQHIHNLVRQQPSPQNARLVSDTCLFCLIVCGLVSASQEVRVRVHEQRQHRERSSAFDTSSNLRSRSVAKSLSGAEGKRHFRRIAKHGELHVFHANTQDSKPCVPVTGEMKSGSSCDPEPDSPSSAMENFEPRRSPCARDVEIHSNNAACIKDNKNTQQPSRLNSCVAKTNICAVQPATLRLCTKATTRGYPVILSTRAEGGLYRGAHHLLLLDTCFIAAAVCPVQTLHACYATFPL